MVGSCGPWTVGFSVRSSLMDGSGPHPNPGSRVQTPRNGGSARSLDEGIEDRGAPRLMFDADFLQTEHYCRTEYR